MERPRQLAGFFTQIQVVFYKNLLLYKSSKLGIVFELLFVGLASLLYLVAYNAFESRQGPTMYSPKVLNVSSFSLSKSRVYYYPNNSFVEELVKKSFAKIVGNPSVASREYVGTNHSMPENVNKTWIDSTFAFVSFPADLTSYDHSHGSLVYTLFTPENGTTDSYETRKILEPKNKYMFDKSPESECSDLYTSILQETKYHRAFMKIKDLIDSTFMTGYLAHGGQSSLEYDVYTRKIDCAGYKQNLLNAELSFLIPMIICMCHLVTFLLNVSSIILEKESKFREYLRLIGVRLSVITICWMIRSFLIYSILSIVITVSLRYRIGDVLLLSTTSTPVVFITCFLYSMQCICLSILFGQFFSKTFWAKSISIIVWLVTSLNIFTWASSMTKYLLAVFPNSALLFSFQFIFQYERSDKSLSLTEIFTNLYDDPLMLGSLWVAMIFWSIVYIVLGWYLEKVFPGEYGVKMPFYFPFMPSYWRRRSDDNDSKSKLDAEMGSREEETKFLSANSPFEEIPAETKRSIRLHKLSKVFSTGFERKIAVRKLSFEFCDNQITGFLGHNGAGKSTVLFMMCGLYSPTSGSVKILDYDIRTDLDKIRSLIGYCPQINIQYDNLTCRQHLYIVCKIKGFSSKETSEEIKRIARFVGLHDDLSKKSSELSGGMKRRLQFAMAIVGNAKVIILDEPTSGLDPFNRRELWNLIKSYKNDRTIILTTHNMEEADTLSDRIAVINHGRVMCSGSPFYLKERFGSGYRLTITKSEEQPMNELEFNKLYARTMSASKPNVESSSSREMTLLIPSSLKSYLPTFLDSLEKFKTQLNIMNYGITSSTVEDVFLKVGKIDLNEDMSPSESFDFSAIKNSKIIKKGPSLLFKQVGSLFLKRFRILKSRLTILLATFLLPALLILLHTSTQSKTSLIDSLIQEFLTIEPAPPLELSLDTYGPERQVLLVSSLAIDKESSEEAAKFARFAQEVYKQRRNNIHLEILTAESKSSDIGKYIYAKRLEKPVNYIRNYLVGLEFKFAAKKLASVVIYSSSMAHHTQAVGLNEANSLVFAYTTGSVANSIRTINWPKNLNQTFNIPANLAAGQDLSLTSFLSCFEIPPFSIYDIVIALLVALWIAFTVIHVTRERVNGSKSLQLMSKTNSSIYWLSNYLFDGLVYLINIFIFIGIIVLCYKLLDINGTDFGRLVASSPTRVIVYLGVFLAATLASSLTLAYACSRLFKSDILAFAILFVVLMSMVMIDSGLAIAATLVKIAHSPEHSKSEDNDRMAGQMHFDRIGLARTILAIIFPNVNAKRTVYNLKIQSWNSCRDILTDTFNITLSKSSGFSLDTPGIGMFLLYALLSFFIWLFVLVLIENEFRLSFLRDFLRKVIDCVRELIKPGSTKPIRLGQQEIPEEVQEESRRLEKADLTELVDKEPIVVKNLSKLFKKGSKYFYAVDNLSFGVATAECFGLLGLNGAGKTTTIEILTGQKEPSDGSTYLNGFNSNTRRSSAIAELGICPQFDMLPEYLTVRESLELFGNLRGLHSSDLNSVVETLLKTFQLNEFRNKLVQTLSGGNKRKLSSAIAVIGRPRTIIMDEPTAGMDPVARRYLWNIIKSIRMMGTTILLTSHDMKECEVLCTKLGIMVNGQFRCFGNIQNLKNKYGKGYTLILKCKASREETREQNEAKLKIIKDFVQAHIQNAILKDTQSHTLFYQIALRNSSNRALADSGDQSVAKIFNLIEQNKEQLNLENYLLSQTTLDQIFLSLADTSRNNLDEENMFPRDFQV